MDLSALEAELPITSTGLPVKVDYHTTGRCYRWGSPEHRVRDCKLPLPPKKQVGKRVLWDDDDSE